MLTSALQWCPNQVSLRSSSLNFLKLFVNVTSPLQISRIFIPPPLISTPFRFPEFLTLSLPKFQPPPFKLPQFLTLSPLNSDSPFSWIFNSFPLKFRPSKLRLPPFKFPEFWTLPPPLKFVLLPFKFPEFFTLSLLKFRPPPSNITLIFNSFPSKFRLPPSRIFTSPPPNFDLLPSNFVFLTLPP